MNRRQKIIVSVTGIFLVLLILVGLTYAYFLTQITGNTNTKSISVSTANLKLVYEDGTPEILMNTDSLIPSSEPIGTKTFTVTNKGDATNYVVLLENVIVKDTEANLLTTFESNDFVYTLKCEKKDGSSCNGVTEQTTLPLSVNSSTLVSNDIDSGDIHTYEITLYYLDNGKDQSNDMNKTLEAKINIEDPARVNPYYNNTESLAYNIINNALNATYDELFQGYATFVNEEVEYPVGYTLETQEIDQAYELYGDYFVIGDNIVYEENKITLSNPQIIQMNDTPVGCFGYLVKDGEVTEETIDLSDKYISSDSGYSSVSEASQYITEGTEFSAVYTATYNETDRYRLTKYYMALTQYKYETAISQTEDEYTESSGKNSYYFSGPAKNNYVEFNGMCWRIVRIEGDGSIKIILAKEGLCSTITESDTKSAFIDTGVYGYKTITAVMGSVAASDYIGSTSGMRSKLNSWLSSDKFNTTTEQIKEDNWCIGNMRDAFDTTGAIIGTPNTFHSSNEFGGHTFYYSSYIRNINNNPSLICDNTGTDGEIDKNVKIGTLTMDEVMLANSISNGTSYLKDNASDMWMTLSPSFFDSGGVSGNTGSIGSDELYLVDTNGILYASYYYDDVDKNYSIRPAITLKSNIEIADITVDGTISNPYKIQ